MKRTRCVPIVGVGLLRWEREREMRGRRRREGVEVSAGASQESGEGTYSGLLVLSEALRVDTRGSSESK
jgi:hypothetical protein